MQNFEGVIWGVVDDYIANCLVIFGGRVVIRLVCFDEIGLKDYRGQVGIDRLENQRLGLDDEVSRLAFGITAVFEVLRQPAFEIYRFTNVQGGAFFVCEDIYPGR